VIDKRVLVFVLFTVLCSHVSWARPLPKKSSQPDIRSYAALVMDANTSSVLYARNERTPRPIASITKLMTSLVVLEGRQSLDEYITITREDRDGTRGSASRLAIGASLTRGELMHLALMASDNRAAHALARSYPGGNPAFVQTMNTKAHLLGMTTAQFVDPSGLFPGNVASATDLSKLMLAVAAHPTIREYSTDPHHSVRLVDQQVEFRNTNYLVAKPDWEIEVQKTGYTSEAGECLAMKTVINGRSMIIVLLDSFGKYTRTADARRIRKWLEAHSSQQVAIVD
jgi:D-alanyl-D-alanine endopeptidase (penicillin-binding protein 7)